MSNRINQLIEECTSVYDDIIYDGRDTRWKTTEYFDKQKFAELIVQECMRMCEVTEMSFVTHECDVEASGAITVKQFIAEHFGVEE